jgi:hypothetical protein
MRKLPASLVGYTLWPGGVVVIQNRLHTLTVTVDPRTGRAECSCWRLRLTGACDHMWLLKAGLWDYLLLLPWDRMVVMSVQGQRHRVRWEVAALATADGQPAVVA